MKVLVTGGAGYIGSVVSRALLEETTEVAIVDNLAGGHREAVPKGARFYRTDILEKKNLSRAMARERPDAVMHFAASMQVGESMREPLKYYRNNVLGTANVLEAMAENGCSAIVFSSTAAVYGTPKTMPITEDEVPKPVNPYGSSKLAAESMIREFAGTNGTKYAILRYFNAAGSAFGIMGESHKPETHIIPMCLNAALHGKKLEVFGTDYPTKDGTCIRDYVHVLDIAKAHMKALDYALKKPSDCFNIASGSGHSVMEVIGVAEKASGKKIKTENRPRRPGDPAELVASNNKALEKLGWKPGLNLEEMVSSALEWERHKKF
ncbi:MAG: UDP-glucose 4-epimerase GalE [Candidatus Diapherotrites archaeon]|uniref:UDP-glucose 4-epimerase GalE n=1 Tax=Candidatus Iainarchaeum sp. TaxID=3101447 RepID=A0A8T3YJE7_9ARCH|nr:UDP-glucose 4-epimerase GalE [Candidatus Diapherotrites archaeon]